MVADLPWVSVSQLPVYQMDDASNPETAMMSKGDMCMLVASVTGCGHTSEEFVLWLVVYGSFVGWVSSDALKLIE